MKINWAATAIDDLASIRRFIAAGDVALARRITVRVLRAVSVLARLPAAGRPGRVRNTRELVLADQPYIVAYRVEANTVEVLRVLHTSRRWPKRR